MKKLIVTTLMLVFSLGLTYRAYGLYGWFSAQSVYVNYCSAPPCDHTYYNCDDWPENHWRVGWSSSLPGPCNSQKPKYNGTTITPGHWANGLNYQLTKSWMFGKCLNNVTCAICLEDATCSADKFTAYCYYN